MNKDDAKAARAAMDAYAISRGDYVRRGANWIGRIARVWTIDRGPDRGEVKATAVTFIDVRGYRGWGMSTIDVAKRFEPFPYTGPEIPLP